VEEIYVEGFAYSPKGEVYPHSSGYTRMKNSSSLSSLRRRIYQTITRVGGQFGEGFEKWS